MTTQLQLKCGVKDVAIDLLSDADIGTLLRRRSSIFIGYSHILGRSRAFL